MLKNCLIKGPISPGVITSLLEERGRKTDSGGHSVFLGQVRADEIEGKRVKAIEYSAYDAMVNIEAAKIINSVLEQYNDVKSIDILHSTGIVKAGEISLFIFVSAGHRSQAIEACSLTVEMVKKALPVWKKELYDDNSHSWK